MKIISLFNNKGGVGKSTLGFHLGHALKELGHRVLMIDLDPQCNLTIFGIETERLHQIWQEEDEFIEDFETAFSNNPNIIDTPRSVHFILKPTEDGLSDLTSLPPVVNLADNLDLIPGRLSIHKYENKIAERWNGAYQGDNLSIRTITNIRNICLQYRDLNSYDYILIDTSPSLGILNKTIISTVDGFLVPAQPDMFSLYGIRNIGNSLSLWQRDFNTIYSLISEDKRRKFPERFVQFLGFTIYNAKPYSGLNDYDLAQAHFYYLEKIPDVINEFIKEENRRHLSQEMLETPIGKKATIHTHNTFPSVAQVLKCPMWEVPDVYTSMRRTEPERLRLAGLEVNQGSFGLYRDTREKYLQFARDLLLRTNTLQ